jgi:receptor protein-tyrosine kinase
VNDDPTPPYAGPGAFDKRDNTMTDQTPTDRTAGKAADRLWLIERAAERLDAGRMHGHAAAQPAATAAAAAAGTASLAERAGTAAGSAAAARPAESEPAAQPVSEPTAGAGRTSGPKTVRLDLVSLQQQGYLTPATMTTGLAEEMRLIKRNVLHRFRKGSRAHANVILVTSSLPGEGKSFVALNLAMSLACEYDLRVVLVDADFGRPDLMTRMGVHEPAGLLDVVAHAERDLSEVLLRTDIDRLSLIPSGQNRELASELVSSARMRLIMEELATRYPDRLVILDTAPVLADSGTAILSEYAGQVLFVVEADTTDRATIDSALDLLPGDQEPQVVLNKNRGRGKVRAPYYKYAAT